MSIESQAKNTVETVKNTYQDAKQGLQDAKDSVTDAVKGKVQGIQQSFDNVKTKLQDGYDSTEEGFVTRTVENQTSKIPSIVWLSLAAGSVAAGASLQFSKKKEWGNFVGLLAPCFLLLGIYNKIVKEEHEAQNQLGLRNKSDSDRDERRQKNASNERKQIESRNQDASDHNSNSNNYGGSFASSQVKKVAGGSR